MENKRLIRWLILAAFLQIVLSPPSYAVNPEKLTEDQYVQAYFNMYGDYLSGTKNVTKEKLSDVIEYYMTTDDVAKNLHYVGTSSGEMIGSMLADSGVDFDCGTCDASVLGQKCCLYRIGEKPRVYECVGSEVKTVSDYQWKNIYECTLGCCNNNCCRDPNAPTTTTGATTTTTLPSGSCPSVCSTNGYSVSDCIHSSCSEPSHEGTGSCSGWGSGVCCCSNCGDTICNRNPSDGETPQNCPNDCSGTTTTTSTTTTTTKPGLPDLSVQSAWNLNKKICYALHNDGAAAPASTSNLTVDGTLVATGSATALPAGSSSSNNCFDSYDWTCSGASDTVRICADSPGSIAESDETNNCITETLSCSTTTTTGSSTTSTTSSTTSTASTTTSTSPGTSTSTSSTTSTTQETQECFDGTPLGECSTTPGFEEYRCKIQSPVPFPFLWEDPTCDGGSTTTTQGTTTTTNSGGDICVNCCQPGQTDCTLQCPGGTYTLNCVPSITDCQYDGQTVTIKCGTNTQQASCLNGKCPGGSNTTTTNSGTTTTTGATTTTTGPDDCQSDEDCINKYGGCYACPYQGADCWQGPPNCGTNDDCKYYYGSNWTCVSQCCIPS